ncbi:MAG: response regulator [Clostridiales bacterium]|nr:response regulator [Clostridiales bacterium]
MARWMEAGIEDDKQFESIWNHVECGIAVIDMETMEILKVNPIAMKMFGGGEGEMMGKPCHKVFCPSDLCPIVEERQEIDRSERSFVTKSGEALPIIKSVTRITYKGRPALLESFIDLSPMKAIEAEEARRSAESAAAELDQSKKRFLSQISHEMRTPMNVLHGMLQIAQYSEDANELRYYLDRMSDSSEQLFALINEFFDMSEIEAGKFALEHTSINIEKMLINVCNIMKEKVEAKSIKLPILFGKDMRMGYIGDERRLSQVLLCLLSNAVKFSPSAGKIRIMVEEALIEEGASILRFSVKDNGIGMTEEQIEKIWDTFAQAEKDTFDRFGGVGLGLTIAKSIVDKMGGTMWARSKPGKGSTFYFEVPLKRSIKQDGPVIIDSIRPSDIKILVVDGDHEARDGVCAVIHSFGINVDGAETVERADSLVKLAKAAGNPYDIILCDYGSSDLDGVEAAKRINPYIDSNTVVVLITPTSKWRRIERYARSIGVNYHISKPLFPSVVMDFINEIISRAVKQFDIHTAHTNKLPDLSDMWILVAEDVEVNREILIGLLRETKIHMDYVENGKKALEKIRKNPDKYDLVVTDIRMPVMDGYELAQAIRALDSDRERRIPIIALSAEAINGDMDQYKASGIDGYLTKPLDINLLCDTILRYKQQGGAK